MRFLLACLLALTLSFNPISGFAATQDCGQAMAQMTTQASDMSNMDMSAMSDASKSKPDVPCCPHPMKDCAKACAAMSAATPGVLPQMEDVRFFAEAAVQLDLTTQVEPSFKPPNLDRPPRLTA